LLATLFFLQKLLYFRWPDTFFTRES